MEIKIDETRLSAEQLATLNQIIAEANKSRRWKPKHGERYYFCTNYGDVDVVLNEEFDSDIGRIKIGNRYKTREEAQFAADKALCIAELQNYADEHNEGELNWIRSVYVYSICYDHTAKRLFPAIIDEWQHQGTIYYSSEDICLSAIAAIGEDRIKKYLFGVES